MEEAELAGKFAALQDSDPYHEVDSDSSNSQAPEYGVTVKNKKVFPGQD